MIEGPSSDVESDPIPDVLPDVAIHQFVKFDRPDVRLEELTTFDTAPSPQRGGVREWIESLALHHHFRSGLHQLHCSGNAGSDRIDETDHPGRRSFLPRQDCISRKLPRCHSPLPAASIDQPPGHHRLQVADGWKYPFVKRVIGLPGETVEVQDKAVYINGRKLDEPYKIHVDSTDIQRRPWTPEELKIRDNYGPVTVPPDSYFVMGDNRDNSNDSRYWGFVTWDEIIGKPLFVYWSYESDPYVPGDKTFREWLDGYASVAMHFFDEPAGSASAQ